MKRFVKFFVIQNGTRYYVGQRIRETNLATGEIVETERKLTLHYSDKGEAERVASLLNSDRPHGVRNE